jgi:hypothetical protein
VHVSFFLIAKYRYPFYSVMKNACVTFQYFLQG